MGAGWGDGRPLDDWWVGPEREDDPLGRALGGDFPPYGEYLGTERARAGELALELLERREQIARLEEQLRQAEARAWEQAQVIAGLTAELRGVGATIAALHAQVQTLRAASLPPLTQPESEPETDPADPATLQAALADLEARLQEAVALVLDEMAVRRAAERRVAHLEQQLWWHNLAPSPTE
jgi:chromosome segregation ATPase